MNQPATIHDTVTIHFSACTREGGVIEDTHNRKPLVLNLNDSSYTLALRQNVVGMTQGDRKLVIANPEEIFGFREHNRQISVPRSALPAGIQKGDQLVTNIENEEVDAWVVQISDDEAVLDANHPLSGESIEYTIQLISIEKSPQG